MWSARTGSALALAAFLCGKQAPDTTAPRWAAAERAPEEVFEVCLACVGLYPGSCLPVAVCDPDLRVLVRRTIPLESAPIPVRDDSLPVN